MWLSMIMATEEEQARKQNAAILTPALTIQQSSARQKIQFKNHYFRLRRIPMQTYIASCVAALSASDAIYNLDDLYEFTSNKQLSIDCRFIPTSVMHHPNSD